MSQSTPARSFGILSARARGLTRTALWAVLAAGSVAPALLLARGGGGSRGVASVTPGGRPGGIASADTPPAAVRPEVHRVTGLDGDRVRAALDRVSANRADTLPDLLHVLRLFGANASLRDAGISSDGTILESVLTHGRCVRLLGGPALVDTRYGIRGRPMEQQGGSRQRERQAHEGQLLAALAEAGVPLSRPVTTEGGTRSVGAILDDMLANFDTKQKEIEWSAIAIALYLPPRRTWCDKFNRKWSLDDLCKELIDRPLDRKRTCAATHWLYSLSIIIRVDSRIPILSSEVRSSVKAALADAVARAGRYQPASGAWSLRWFEGDASDDPGTAGPDGGWERILATGHQLEWLALMPEELTPDRAATTRAIRWLHDRIDDYGAASIPGHYCPYSHAVKVLLQASGLRGTDLVGEAIGSH